MVVVAADRAFKIPPGTHHLIRAGWVDDPGAFLSDEIHVPLAPFMGFLAVAPIRWWESPA